MRHTEREIQRERDTHREKDRERLRVSDAETHRERERDREYVCVNCVCFYVICIIRNINRIPWTETHKEIKSNRPRAKQTQSEIDIDKYKIK